MIYQKCNQETNNTLHVASVIGADKRSPEQKQAQEQQLTEIRRNFVRNIKYRASR